MKKSIIKCTENIQEGDQMSKKITPNIFTERLFEKIKLSGKSVNQIERELGYPRNAISNYKNGGEPSGTRLIELAKYFQVSPEYLIGKTSSMEEISPRDFFDDMNSNQKIEIGELYLKWIISYMNIDKTSEYNR